MPVGPIIRDPQERNTLKAVSHITDEYHRQRSEITEERIGRAAQILQREQERRHTSPDYEHVPMRAVKVDADSRVIKTMRDQLALGQE